jgi:hypothetical protein
MCKAMEAFLRRDLFHRLWIIQELGIDADYNKSPVDVFTQATDAFIRHNKRYCLGFSTFPKDLAGLPSWVPDWAIMARVGMPFYPVSYGSFPKFKASSNTQQTGHHMMDVKGLSILTLSGCLLGHITSVMASDSVTMSSTRNEEIRKYCLANDIVDDGLIIRTFLMDDITLRQISQSPRTRYLNLAKMAFGGLEKIDEQTCSPEDVELLSRYNFDDHIVDGCNSLVQRHLHALIRTYGEEY